MSKVFGWVSMEWIDVIVYRNSKGQYLIETQEEFQSWVSKYVVEREIESSALEIQVSSSLYRSLEGVQHTSAAQGLIKEIWREHAD